MAQAQGMESQSKVSNKIDLQEEVDYTFLRDVSKDVVQWEELAQTLGLSNAKIHNIQEDYARSASERKYQMLVAWKQMNGRNSTYSALIDGLNKADLKTLADDIMAGKYTGSSLR